MSYVMEYATDIKPNEEIIEEQGIKVFIDPNLLLAQVAMKKYKK